jgi:hypothetical protein
MCFIAPPRILPIVLRACAAAFLLLAAALPLISGTANASSAGPPPARTGGFGEMTCHECHWENPINDPPGSLTVSGVPSIYTPGEAYTITVSVAHVDSKRAGFQLSARADGAPAGSTTAGRLRPIDPMTEVVEEKGIAYISQTEAGSRAVTSDRGAWTFEWTAPSSTDRVVFHAAANAANGDASPLGDYIYTTTATSAVRQP